MSAPGSQMFQRFTQPGQRRPRRPGEDEQRLGGGLPGIQPPGGGRMMFQTQDLQQPQIAQAPAPSNRPTPLAPGTALNQQSLQPFLGSAGRVKYDPFTSRTIALDKRVNPTQFQAKQLATQGPEEAQNFRFNDLPASPTQAGGAIDQLGNAAGNLITGGQQNVQGGQDLIGGAAQNLLGTQAANQAQVGNEQQIREAALNELQGLQRQALSPNLSPEQRQFYQQRADERRAEVQGLQGNLMDAFQRQQGSNAAQLAARGVLDSTTGSNTMAETQRRLGLDMNALNQQANEASRQEQLAGTEANRAAAGQFGGLQSSQAGTAGGILSNLLGQQVGAGSSLGQIGVGQGGLGAELSKLGISGLGAAGELGISGRGQEADLQQAELLTRLMGNQTAFNNIQSYLNNNLNRRVTNARLQQLLNPPKTGGGFMGGLLGAVGGIAGGLLGGPAGAGSGSQLGRVA